MSSNRLVAIKCCEKLKIRREKKAQYIKREKDIMAKLKHPLFVHLFYTFQDETRLCE
jgi:3-phosphoinositide dependent protein kinase-1